MNVKELIEQLQKEGQDLPVVIYNRWVEDYDSDIVVEQQELQFDFDAKEKPCIRLYV